ncbi:MAG: hypothetical protein IKT93_02995, partial [Clostridia bacterium]|nr:hypothetical protein [Clostridia bacterium]
MRKFISLISSFVFILGVVAVPFYYSIVALTKPKTVAMVIREVDYKQVIQKNPALKKTFAKYDITPTDVDTIMKSTQAGELVEIYADEVTQIFLDIPDKKKLDVGYIKGIVNNNIDKFLDITEQNTNFKLDHKTLKKEVAQFLEKNEPTIEESVELIEEVRDVVKTIHTSRVVEKKISFWIAVVFIIVSLIMMADIIVLMHSNGFLWVGIDFAIISVLLGLIIGFCKSNFINTLALGISNFGVSIIESAIMVSTEKMLIAAFGTTILSVLFIGFFVALKLLKRKYLNNTLPKAQEDIAVEEL